MSWSTTFDISKSDNWKKISAYYSIEDDVNNSGATYVNAPVVIDQNIVSSPHYNWMGEWMKAAIEKSKNIHNETRQSNRTSYL